MKLFQFQDQILHNTIIIKPKINPILENKLSKIFLFHWKSEN